MEAEEAPEVREQGFFFKLVGGISRWGAYLGGVTLIVITAIVTYDVFARFLGHPTDWATEVAGYMVIGVAVLGAGETLRHNEHFAMHLVVDVLQPRVRRRVGLAVWSVVTALVAGLCWGLLALVDNSLQYGLRSSTIVGAPLAVPQLVLLLGFVVLLLALVARLVALVHRIREGAAMIALGVLLFFFALVVAGTPIFGAMGIAALTGVWLLDESTTPLLNLGLTVYQSLGNFLLIAVPLYIYAGTLMEVAGLNEKLFRFARVWVGAVPGGLGVATVVACAIFAAICGSSVATAVTIGLVAFPALVRGGYTPHFSGSLIAAGGTLGILIPPSIAMIIFGVLTEQSIAQLFIAGAVPGVLLATLMAIYAIFFSGVRSDPTPITWIERIQVTREAILVLMLPLGVLFSIYSGLATPTEVAALAVTYVIVIGIATRMLTWQHFWDATMKATRTSVMIFMMIAFGQALTEFFTLTGLPQMVVDMVSSSGLGYLAVVTLMVLIYILLGTFLEATSMMLVSVPIMFPLAKAIGMDPLAFGVFVVLAVEVAQIHPPFGINLYALSGIGKVHIGRMSISVIPYIVMMISMMFAISIFPQIVTWLPKTMR